MFLYLRVFLLIQQNCLYQQFFILPEPISRRHFTNFTNFAFLYNSVIFAQDVRILTKLEYMNNLDLFIEMKYTYLKPGCSGCPVRYSGLSAEGFCGYKGMLLENFIRMQAWQGDVLSAGACAEIKGEHQDGVLGAWQGEFPAVGRAVFAEI